jgi:hypothetical protein
MYLRYLFAACGIALMSSPCFAQQSPRVVNLTVNVKNSKLDSSNFSGSILGPDGSTILSATGLPEKFALAQQTDNAPADYNYVLAVSFGPRYEQYYINVRDVHFGKIYNWNTDGTELDLTQRSSQIQSICANGQANIEKYLQRFTYCRAMYYSYPAGENAYSRFIALRGWFDASIALASMPSSLFATDPELVKVVRELENQGSPGYYRSVFPSSYVEAQLASAKQAQLADLREIPSLLKKGDAGTALKVNERSTTLFRALTAGDSANQTAVVHGITNELLTGNKQYLETLATQRPNT